MVGYGSEKTIFTPLLKVMSWRRKSRSQSRCASRVQVHNVVCQFLSVLPNGQSRQVCEGYRRAWIPRHLFAWKQRCGRINIHRWARAKAINWRGARIGTCERWCAAAITAFSLRRRKSKRKCPDFLVLQHPPKGVLSFGEFLCSSIGYELNSAIYEIDDDDSDIDIRYLWWVSIWGIPW